MRKTACISLSMALFIGLAACSEDDPTDDSPAKGGQGHGGAGGAGGGPAAPVHSEVDIVADANRDGVVNAEDTADQEREEEWGADVGASFIANLDDDDNDGIADCEDEIINSDADLLDLAPFSVTAFKDVAKGSTATVTIDAESAQSVRVFQKTAAGEWKLVLGSIGPCTSVADCSYTTELALKAEDIRAGVTFGIEGRRFKGQPLASLVDVAGLSAGDSVKAMDAKKNTWSGIVDVAYTLKGADGKALNAEGNPDGVDRLKMRIAPWILLGSLGKHDELWSSKVSSAFVKGNTTFTTDAAVRYNVISTSDKVAGGWSDMWTEDFFQTGWTAYPGPDGTARGMRIGNPRPWGRWDNDPTNEGAPRHWLAGNKATGRAPAWLGPDRGVGVFYDAPHEGTGHTQDSHGAHDLIPPHEGYPMGRIITSNRVMADTVSFYNAQQVQGPALIIDTEWLAVEHVDEFFHWVPAKTPHGWKLLVASPALMLKMLQDLKTAGHGSLQIHKGKMPKSYQVTVDEALASVELNAWSETAQIKIQGHVDTLKTETGLTDDEIIPVPTWFEDADGDDDSKIAWNPGMVNMRLMGDRADIAKPFGPLVDGKDPFEEDMLARLGTETLALGSEGKGLKVFFTDDWYYHSAMGEVHCGTNESAPISRDLGLWWESGK